MGMGGLRESVVGRLLLVVLVATALWGAWSLILRPYPSGSNCGTPVAALTKPSVEIPRATEPEPRPPRQPDYDGNGRVTDFEQELFDNSGDAAESLSRVPGNARERARATVAEANRVQCRDALAEAGFWIRGLGPFAAVVGSVAVGMFVMTGHVRDTGPGQDD